MRRRERRRNWFNDRFVWTVRRVGVIVEVCRTRRAARERAKELNRQPVVQGSYGSYAVGCRIEIKE